MEISMNNRIGRINEDIQRELSSLIRKVKDPRVQQGMISITGVDTTGDLRYAKVYISILGSVDEKELKKGLKSASPWLRRELGNILTLRYTPELIFERDSSMEYGAHIAKIINGLDIPTDEGSEKGL
jgi:ribosome-binding factor A